ncbi:hypothetical protein ASPCAL04975 [Aspergillus calidoustus]|uniref:Uncharacterized protein n=1 Tax=Aspergillus calidoustus TaxID=454130 RepID=A0A0U5FWH9_ASPCI|nr:hypothetical protein ASPCAL04975 [Aspergillus calidoustus]
MDPLSCAASVIAVIQLAGALADICGNYIKRVKNARKEINDLKGEINSLRSILESLNNVLHGPGGENLIALQKIFDDVGKCNVILRNLGDKINPETTQSSIRRRAFRYWKWPLQRMEVDEVISQLKGCTSLFVAALQIDHVLSTDRFERKFDLRSLKIVEEAAYDSSENKHKECLPKTRVELLRQVTDWAEAPQGKCIYLLNGGAGTGKSTISRTIARQLNDKRLLAASFFFKRGEEGRNNAKWLFSTLAQQLAIAIPELGPGIQKAVEADPYISGKVPTEQFNKLILQPLINLDLGRAVTMVAVIDALDECQSDTDSDDHNIKVLLRLLSRAQESKSVRLRFFLTSRPELAIRLSLKAVKDSLQNVDLHSIPTSEITHDISIFLDHSFSRIRENHDLPAEWPGEKAINDLLARTVPLFISAATLCQYIGDMNWDPRDRLQEILSAKSTYVSKMASTYLPVLNQLFKDQDRFEAQQIAKEFRQMVGPIIMLATPLPVNGVSKLLGIDPTKIKKRLSQLHSVLIVPDDLDTPVKLQHLSFRDFLLDYTTKDDKESEKFWIDSEAIHQKLTDQCLVDDKSSQDSKFLYDARRFVLKNRHLAETAPLQLYTSGLIFCPGNSITRRMFSNNLSSRSQLPEVEESWGAEQQTLEGHSDSILLVAFSPDSKELASSSSDNTIKLWDPTTGELRQNLEGHSDSVRSVAFSPDGKQLASGSNDKTIMVWDPMTGELRQNLKGHSGFVSSVVFSPDGKQLASSSSDKTIKLWDSITGKLQQTLEGHSGWVRSVTFSLDGRQLASGSGDKTIKLWDPITGEELQTFEGHSDPIRSVIFSPDGRQLASGSDDKTVKLWDHTMVELSQTLEGHFDSVWSIAFSQDGKQVASGSDDKTIRLWDRMTGKLQHILGSHSGFIRSIAFSPDNRQLVSGSSDKTIRLWDPITGKLQQTLKSHSDWVLSVAFSPDGRQLASGSSDNTIKLWDPTTGTLQQTLEGHSSWVISVTFSLDGRKLASGSGDNTIKLWDPTTGKLRHTLKGHSDPVRSLAFSPDSRQLASSADDKSIKLWDPATGELQQTLAGHSGWVWFKAGAGISVLRDQWLCLQRRKILWLPPAYRPVCFALNNGLLGLGHASGRVSLISTAGILD